MGSFPARELLVQTWYVVPPQQKLMILSSFREKKKERGSFSTRESRPQTTSSPMPLTAPSQKCTACCSMVRCERSLYRGITTNCCRELEGTSKERNLQKALQGLHKLEDRGFEDCAYTYVCLLQGCIQSNSLQDGRLLHNHIVKSVCKPNVYIGTAILNMYARCGDIDDARAAFKDMSDRNIVTWNTMIAAYSNHDKFEKALDSFWKLQKEGLTPNDVSFVSAFKACAGLESLRQGKKIHGLLKKREIKPTTLVGNSLLNMYVKCGSMEEARQVFDNMGERDASSWNVMIVGYVKNGNVRESVRLFSMMRSTSIKPDEVTYVNISNACATLRDLEQAKRIHALIKESDVTLNILMWNTLIDMYAKCGSLIDAEELFRQAPERQISTWNAFIGGLTKLGHCEDALLFHEQMTAEGYCPDQVSYVIFLTACAALEDLRRGRQAHARLTKSALSVNVFVENALVDMYVKCGSLSNARQFFDQMSVRNVVSWNTILVGYGKYGLHQEVFSLSEKMAMEGTQPDTATFVSLLNACALLTALEQGLEVHNGIVRNRFELDLFVGNALIDMYAKCGRIRDACKVLDKMLERDVVSWNTMLAGYAQHGLGQEALQLGRRMLDESVEFNHVSFVGILTACSHGGLVDEGWYYFSTMTWIYGVKQAIEHYGCIIDLLSRAGHLDQAKALLKSMSSEASALLWRALLGACRTHGNLDLAIHAAECILDMEPQDTAAILLVSYVHALAADGWEEDQASLISLMNIGDEEDVACA